MGKNKVIIVATKMPVGQAIQSMGYDAVQFGRW